VSRNPDDARHEDCGDYEVPDASDLDADTADGEPADLEDAFAAVHEAGARSGEEVKPETIHVTLCAAWGGISKGCPRTGNETPVNPSPRPDTLTDSPQGFPIERTDAR
jgi:hypothetical protein